MTDAQKQEMQMQMLMRMLQQQQLSHGGHHGGHHGGQHSHDGVNFHDANHGAPDPGMHSHDGVNFHGSHGSEGHHEEPKDEPGIFAERVLPYTATEGREWGSKAFTIGIAGPVGSGKTTLLKKLCSRFSKDHSMAVIINDLYTTLDGEGVIASGVLPSDRVKALTTGIWSRVAIDEDIEDNFTVAEAVSKKFDAEFMVIEAAGDNLGANFDRNLSDFTIFVLDTAAGEQAPLKGGKGVTQADLLVLNKTDLAPLCGVKLDVLEANARKMRGEGPVMLAQVGKDVGVDAIVNAVLAQFEKSGAKAFYEARTKSKK
ncbi:CobW/HypB/UreG, nucleotide-binding domain-containing protein [Chytriomyces sp. MP71]|nr:CobW/HypB/UreG, nucleotide-binding domain-containing protein [Chytriomyces sp. MP71]